MNQRRARDRGAVAAGLGAALLLVSAIFAASGTPQAWSAQTEEQEQDAPLDVGESPTDAPDDGTEGSTDSPDDGTESPTDDGTDPDLLVAGDGTTDSESTTTTEVETTATASGPSDSALITTIIVGLVTVALLVALLTWRYWVATKPVLRPVDGRDNERGAGLGASRSRSDT